MLTLEMIVAVVCEVLISKGHVIQTNEAMMQPGPWLWMVDSEECSVSIFKYSGSSPLAGEWGICVDYIHINGEDYTCQTVIKKSWWVAQAMEDVRPFVKKEGQLPAPPRVIHIPC